MVDAHRLIAYSIPTAFAVLMLATIYSFLRDRPPPDWFWRVLGVVQVVLGIQIVLGGILFAIGHRAPTWRHYAYGALFPLFLLLVAHQAARSDRFKGIPHLPFGLAALLIVGLTIQAVRTGFG